MVILPKFEILRHNLLGQLKLVILFVFRICTFSRNIFEESLYTYRSFSLPAGEPGTSFSDLVDLEQPVLDPREFRAGVIHACALGVDRMTGLDGGARWIS